MMGWIRTAKENLPAINDCQVASDRILEVSALIDRLHHAAHALKRRLAAPHKLRAA
jgi:hypothetical protein